MRPPASMQSACRYAQQAKIMGKADNRPWRCRERAARRQSRSAAGEDAEGDEAAGGLILSGSVCGDRRRRREPTRAGARTGARHPARDGR